VRDGEGSGATLSDGTVDGVGSFPRAEARDLDPDDQLPHDALFAAARRPVPQRTLGVPEPMAQPLVGVIMGSRSDWDTMKNAVETLEALGVAHEVRVVSAHRTPDLLFEYASEAEGRGLEVIIAGAGGAAHLPGMVASKTVLPVLGVPVQSRALSGLDSLLSIVQMPGGVPVGTLAIGSSGAVNAALLAAAMLGSGHREIRESLREFRERRTRAVLNDPDPRVDAP